MKKSITRMLAGSFSALLTAALTISSIPANTFAVDTQAEIASTSDPFIMVSMGDSYSAGEGIEPFYGQDKPVTDTEDGKVNDPDWLAHRSEKSWPGRLTVPGITGTMKDYKKDPKTGSNADVQWYFVASSGAVTSHFQNSQKKKLRVKKLWGKNVVSTSVRPQLEVFDKIDADKVDYVTMTIGGNDVGFADIIYTAYTQSAALHKKGNSELEQQLKKIWDGFDDTAYKIKQAYRDVHAAAPNATIIVAGYPKLLDKDGESWLLSEKENKIINDNVVKFIGKLNGLVDEVKAEGIDIHFVDVLDKFDGHEAYTSDEWINEVFVSAKSQDLDYKKPSQYSVHPNDKGAAAYAECVNAKISELEGRGTLSGRVCKASDRTKPVANATVKVYKDNQLVRTIQPDANGNYKAKLEAGRYRIETSASGYLTFTAYADVTDGNNTYLETFLLVSGNSNERGIASGTVYDAVTGGKLDKVTLKVRWGWNAPESGYVIQTASSKTDGSYSMTLPLGNYTITATKNDYVTASYNIVVQTGTTANQNITISPKNGSSSGNYRIVLTWGATPRDLDSHVYGKNSSGTPFHVYYSTKNQSENGKLICGLDVDDTTSYGPETITLNANTKQPYYYYIYNYSGEGAMATSGAQIKVYQGSTLIRTYNVPTNQADSRYWNVFAIKNGKIIDRNTITSSAETGYAN